VTFSAPSGLQDRSMRERNGLNRRSSSLCANENHQSSTHFVDQQRADSIMARGSAPQTGRIHLRRPNPPAPKILLAIGRRTIQFAQPRRRRAYLAAKLNPENSHLPGLSEGGSSTARRVQADCDVPRFSQPFVAEDFRVAANSLGVR
jgi:hypothetical protein